MFIFNSYFKVFKKMIYFFIFMPKKIRSYFYFIFSFQIKRKRMLGGGGRLYQRRGWGGEEIAGEGGKEGRTAAGQRLLGGIEDRFQSSSVQLVFNLCFGIYSSLLLLVQFFGSVSCAFTGVHRFLV